MWARRKKPVGQHSHLKHECPICNKHFKTEDFLQFHIKTQHGPTMRRPGELPVDLEKEVDGFCLAQVLCDVLPCGDAYFEYSKTKKSKNDE